MGRPVKGHDIPATEKIENAFWELLETTPYSEITIQKLAETAGVNRNAIYYHYDNADDVAGKAFESFINSSAVDAFASAMLDHYSTGRALTVNAGYIEGLRKLQLCARSDSIFLICLLRHAIKSKWLGVLGIDESQLDDMDKLCIDFSISGITAIMGSEATRNDPSLMFRFSGTDLGYTVFGSLIDISKKLRNNNS